MFNKTNLRVYATAETRENKNTGMYFCSPISYKGDRRSPQMFNTVNLRVYTTAETRENKNTGMYFCSLISYRGGCPTNKMSTVIEVLEMTISTVPGGFENLNHQVC